MSALEFEHSGTTSDDENPSAETTSTQAEPRAEACIMIIILMFICNNYRRNKRHKFFLFPRPPSPHSILSWTPVLDVICLWMIGQILYC